MEMGLKKVSIFGASGLLGRDVVKLLQKQDDLQLILPGLPGFERVELSDSSAIAAHFNKYQPEIVINCAAYSDVNGCESEQGKLIANAINGQAPGLLAQHCKDRQATLVHISSDYVFGDERSEGYDETYVTKQLPSNEYGRSKLAGEQAIIKVGGGLDGSHFQDTTAQLYILRVAWLFGEGAKNFVSKISELVKTKPTIEVVTDEIGGPTYTKYLAELILWLIQQKPASGIYHAAGQGHCSRYEFATEIAKWVNPSVEIKPALLANFPRPAKVPHVSLLLNTKMPDLPQWQEMLSAYMHALKYRLV
jgi:dTDP-4-dehydrorhamnose reductase